MKKPTDSQLEKQSFKKVEEVKEEDQVATVTFKVRTVVWVSIVIGIVFVALVSLCIFLIVAIPSYHSLNSRYQGRNYNNLSGYSNIEPSNLSWNVDDGTKGISDQHHRSITQHRRIITDSSKSINEESGIQESNTNPVTRIGSSSSDPVTRIPSYSGTVALPVNSAPASEASPLPDESLHGEMTG